MSTTIIVSGPLARPSEYRLPGAKASVVMWIMATPSWLIEVDVPMGEGPEAQKQAVDLARRAVYRADVTAIGTGLIPRTDHGLAVVRLMGLTSLTVNGSPVSLR